MIWTALFRSLTVVLGLALAGYAAPAAAQSDPSVRCAGDVALNGRRNHAEFVSHRQTIPSMIYEPLSPNGGAIVLLHGAGGLGADAERFDHHALQLASRGYRVLVPNYFAARRGRADRSNDDVRVWQEVGSDAIRYVSSLPGVDEDRVAIWGYSLGGFLATDGAMDSNSPARAAIGVSTGTDVWRPSRDRRTLPVLLIHGRRDPVVSYNSMLSLAASLRGRGAKVETIQIASNQHPIDIDGWCDVFAHTRAFLDTHLTISPIETGTQTEAQP